MSKINSSNFLLDVAIIRPIIIFLLIVVHSFTIYGGGWPLPADIVQFRPYWWIAKFSYSGVTESFVFISGILLCHQLLNKNITAKQLIIKKIQRLYFPSIVFSTLYFIFFEKYNTIFTTIYGILSGLGHMWFLPMLFWCTLAGYYIYKIKARDTSKLIFLVIIAIFSDCFNFLPLQMWRSLYYLFFFYLGFVVYQNKAHIINYLTKRVIVVVLIYLLLFYFGSLGKEHFELMFAYTISQKILKFAIIQFIRLIYSFAAVIVYYILANYLICHNNNLRSCKFLSTLNSNCFGVYIIHQFIIWYLYYYTDLPDLLGTILLPLISVTITTLVSFGASYILNKTIIGKKLIG